mgnify:CR=1 FL=1
MMKTINIFAIVLLIVGLIVGAGIGSIAFPQTITKTIYQTETSTISFTKTVTQVSTETLSRQILDEDEYRAWAVEIALDIARFSQAMSVTAGAISNYEISFSEGAKIFDALEALTRRMLEEAKNVIPPKKYEETHNHLVKAIDYYHQSFVYAAKGAREMDADLLKKAVELATLANAELIHAREAIPELTPS